MSGLDLAGAQRPVVTPDGGCGAPTSGWRTAGSSGSAPIDPRSRPRRRSTPGAASSFPASSTPTCTSTSRAGPTGRAWPPDRPRWRPAAATVFFDMPLNSEPPVLDAASLSERAQLGRGEVRASISPSGAGWCRAISTGWGTARRRGDRRSRPSCAPAGVDEFPGITTPASCRPGCSGRPSWGSWSRCTPRTTPSRGRLAAAAARPGGDRRPRLGSRRGRSRSSWQRSGRRWSLPGETGCALHVVHVSSPEGVALDRRSQEARGRRDGGDLPALPPAQRGGGRPAGRPGEMRAAAARRGAPARPLGARRGRGHRHDRLRPFAGSSGLKSSADFFAVWGGISGCQHAFPLLLSEALVRWPAEAALTRMAGLLAANVARRFRLAPRKGRLAEGADADFVLLDRQGRADPQQWGPPLPPPPGTLRRTVLRGRRPQDRPQGAHGLC